MSVNYEKKFGRKKLEQILPLGMFCYDVNCRTSRVFMGSFENDCFENIEIQKKICERNCKAYKLSLYLKGEKIQRESHTHASNRNVD